MFFVILISMMVMFILCAVFNRYLPKAFCKYLRWHISPHLQGFDGCSFTGVCPRCGKAVLQDSQGNWF